MSIRRKNDFKDMRFGPVLRKNMREDRLEGGEIEAVKKVIPTGDLHGNRLMAGKDLGLHNKVKVGGDQLITSLKKPEPSASKLFADGKKKLNGSPGAKQYKSAIRLLKQAAGCPRSRF